MGNHREFKFCISAPSSANSTIVIMRTHMSHQGMRSTRLGLPRPSMSPIHAPSLRPSTTAVLVTAGRPSPGEGKHALTSIGIREFLPYATGALGSIP